MTKPPIVWDWIAKRSGTGLTITGMSNAGEVKIAGVAAIDAEHGRIDAVSFDHKSLAILVAEAPRAPGEAS